LNHKPSIVLPVVYLIILPATSIMISTALFTLIPVMYSIFLSIGFSIAGVMSMPMVIANAYLIYSQLLLPLIYIFSPLSLILVLISIGYGIYPVFYSIQKYSKKRGNENIVIEFEFIEKLAIIEIVILSIGIIFNFVLPIFKLHLVNSIHTPVAIGSIPINLDFLFQIATLQFMYSVIAVSLRVFTLVGKKEFRFYFAKGCCEIISKSSRAKDDVRIIKYLFLTLDSYNRYLRRNIKFEIKDINKIYSRIIYATEEEKNKVINSVYDSLEGNRFKLARLLSSIYKVPKSELFVRQSLLQQLKVVGALLVVAIPIVISVFHEIPIVISVFSGIKR
jgi:hypothetical protein